MKKDHLPDLHAWVQRQTPMAANVVQLEGQLTTVPAWIGPPRESVGVALPCPRTLQNKLTGETNRQIERLPCMRQNKLLGHQDVRVILGSI